MYVTLRSSALAAKQQLPLELRAREGAHCSGSDVCGVAVSRHSCRYSNIKPLYIAGQYAAVVVLIRAACGEVEYPRQHFCRSRLC